MLLIAVVETGVVPRRASGDASRRGDAVAVAFAGFLLCGAALGNRAILAACAVELVVAVAIEVVAGTSLAEKLALLARPLN